MPQIKSAVSLPLQRLQPCDLIFPTFQHVAHQAHVQSIAALITHDRPERLDLFRSKRLAPDTVQQAVKRR